MDLRLRREDLTSAAFLIGLLLGLFVLSVAVMSIAMNIDLGEAFNHLFLSTAGSWFGILAVLRRTTYLLIVSLGLAVAFRSGVWNVGGEGQILWGGLVSAAVALLLGLSPVLVIPVALISSFVVGGLWGSIAGILKAKLGVNEIVSTMMTPMIPNMTFICRDSRSRVFM